MATQFNADDKNEIKSAAAAGVLAYTGRGLPSWEGQPESRSFLNAFKELFARVVDLQDEVANLTSLVETRLPEVVVPPVVVEEPAQEEVPAEEAPVEEIPSEPRPSEGEAPVEEVPAEEPRTNQ
jgi:hypothetical protein